MRDGSNRLFLVNQRGQIHILKDGALLPTPLLDIGPKIGAYGEQGLLGLAFPPGFATKRCFYIYYTRSDNATVLSRYRMSAEPNIAERNSEEVLLVIPKPHTNHNGGQLAFGPDGLLYISTGDGGGAGDPQRNSQNLASRLGKILRIDVNKKSSGLPYAIPPSNPFASSATRCREILCWGLRNPWRFSFDSLTGDLFIGDVGENEIEEVNFLPAASINAGANFGWSVKEGNQDFNARTGVTGTLRPPAVQYNRSMGYSVTGGIVYRGANPRLKGYYLFGDFMTGRLLATTLPASGGQLKILKKTYDSFSTFGTDEAGEIYFADYQGTGVYRIRAVDDLPEPTVFPEAGIHVGKVSCTMATDVPGAVVRYTTDGSPPDANSPIFTPGTTVDKSEPFLLRAATFRPDMNPSPVVDRLYELRPEYVQIGTGQVSFNDYTTIQLTCPTPNTEIRYTTDGRIPTTASALYAPGSGIFINRNMEVRAIAIRATPGWHPSLVASRQYYLTVSPPQFVSPYSDLYDLVDLASLTPGARFTYSIIANSNSPMAPWPGPLNLPADTLILVSAEKNGMTSSADYLTVRRLSTQEVRFEKIAPKGTVWGTDLARVDDSTFLVISYDTLWKLHDGIWTKFYQNPAMSFISLAIASDGKVAVGYRAGTSGIQILTPSGTPLEQWNLGDAIPMDILPLSTGGFLLADSYGDNILAVTAPSSVTALPAYIPGASPGSPPVRTFFQDPAGIARDDAGRIYVASSYAGRVLKLDTAGMVTTLAGSGWSGWTDGPPSGARFQEIRAIARDRIGNLYVLEKRSGSNGRIRKIMPDGMVVSLRGSLFEPGATTPVQTGSFGPSSPEGLVVDDDGVLYVVGDYTITKVLQEDWDNDGIRDTTEAILGAPFVVGVDDRFADADGDLLSNFAEWVGGTDPRAVTSGPVETFLSKRTDGSIALQFPAEPGKTHQMEYSENLLTWKPVGVPMVSQLKSFTATFASPQFATNRFYRLRTNP